MNKEFSKYKVNDVYVVKEKYCDWSKDCNICLAKYTNGEYFIWVEGEDYKIIKSLDILIYIIRRAESKGLKVPENLIRRITNMDLENELEQRIKEFLDAYDDFIGNKKYINKETFYITFMKYLLGKIK